MNISGSLCMSIGVYLTGLKESFHLLNFASNLNFAFNSSDQGEMDISISCLFLFTR